MLLGNQSSLTRVSGVWRIHGRGWDNMLTRGGVDLTTMIRGTRKTMAQLASLSTMQTWENMQVC